ncbi:MAG: sigma-70 family RNA polymerase sigma factor [Spirochaetes bacterium]|nr:sigma-70 family RNA polymerase sigma factor [Spirochaetota bacterium]
MTDLNVLWYKAAYPERWREALMDNVWREYYRKIVVFISVSYGLSGAADDLAQEVMMKAYEGLDSYDRRYALSTWLYTIARNHCIDYLKRRRVQTVTVSGNEYGTADTERDAMRQALDDAVTRSLSRCGVDDRGIAYLALYERASYKRIAAVFGMSIASVKNRVHALRVMLRNDLKEWL